MNKGMWQAMEQHTMGQGLVVARADTLEELLENLKASVPKDYITQMEADSDFGIEIFFGPEL